MMTLRETHAVVAAVLEPLGIEVGTEVLAVWVDRELHGQEALPAEALRRLAETARRLAGERG